jgi:hypothetical protein
MTKYPTIGVRQLSVTFLKMHLNSPFQQLRNTHYQQPLSIPSSTPFLCRHRKKMFVMKKHKPYLHTFAKNPAVSCFLPYWDIPQRGPAIKHSRDHQISGTSASGRANLVVGTFIDIFTQRVHVFSNTEIDNDSVIFIVH